MKRTQPSMKDKICMVTGATSGIGEVTARTLAQMGATVIVVGRDLQRGAEDFSKFRPGEILVAPATTPAWTPLFSVAAGLVTNYGGLLSHAGVVAREYGLPAVLGVTDATRLIRDGDELTVDGERGEVRVNGKSYPTAASFQPVL